MNKLCLYELNPDDSLKRWGVTVPLHTSGITTACVEEKTEWECLIVSLPCDSDAAVALSEAVANLMAEVAEKPQGECGGLGGLSDLKTPLSEYQGNLQLRVSVKGDKDAFRIGVVEAADGTPTGDGGTHEVRVLADWAEFSSKMADPAWVAGANERAHINVTFRLYSFKGSDGAMVRGLSAKLARPRDISAQGRPPFSIHLWKPPTDGSSGLKNKVTGEPLEASPGASRASLGMSAAQDVKNMLQEDTDGAVAGLGDSFLLSSPGAEARLSTEMTLQRGARAGAGAGFNKQHKNCTSYVHTAYPGDSFFALSGPATLLRSKYEHTRKRQKTTDEPETYLPWSISMNLATEGVDDKETEKAKRAKRTAHRVYTLALDKFYEGRADLVAAASGGDDNEVVEAATNLKKTSWERDCAKWACVDDPDLDAGAGGEDDDSVASTLPPVKYGGPQPALMFDVEHDTIVVWAPPGAEPRQVTYPELTTLLPGGVGSCTAYVAGKCRLYMKMETAKSKKKSVLKCTDPRVKFKAATLWVEPTGSAAPVCAPGTQTSYNFSGF